jgi:hypothetical protein
MGAYPRSRPCEATGSATSLLSTINGSWSLKAIEAGDFLIQQASSVAGRCLVEPFVYSASASQSGSPFRRGLGSRTIRANAENHLVQIREGMMTPRR